MSVLILPIFPALGEVGLFFVLIQAWRHNFPQIVNNRWNWGLAIFAVWLIINSFFAYQPQEAWLGLANFLPFFALFAAVSVLIKQPSQLKKLAWLLVLPSFLVVILGGGQLFANWSIANFIGWELIPQGVPPGRMSSVFIYANFLAIYLLIVLILALGLWLETYQAWQKKLNRQSIWFLVALTIILIGDVIGLVFTSSRNAWGIAILAVLAFACYLGWRWLVWGVVGMATTIAWSAFGPNLGRESLRKIVPAFLWARLSDQMYPDRPIETLRITQWRFCWELITQRPLTGWGVRNFTPLYEAKMNVWFGHPHSLFLMLSVETGLIATVVICGLVASVMLQAILLVKQTRISSEQALILFTYIVAFSGCIIFNLVDVTIFDLRVNTIGWILLAAINGIVLHQRRS